MANARPQRLEPRNEDSSSSSSTEESVAPRVASLGKVLEDMSRPFSPVSSSSSSSCGGGDLPQAPGQSDIQKVLGLKSMTDPFRVYCKKQLSRSYPRQLSNCPWNISSSLNDKDIMTGFPSDLISCLPEADLDMCGAGNRDVLRLSAHRDLEIELVRRRPHLCKTIEQRTVLTKSCTGPLLIDGEERWMSAFKELSCSKASVSGVLSQCCFLPVNCPIPLRGAMFLVRDTLGEQWISFDPPVHTNYPCMHWATGQGRDAEAEADRRAMAAQWAAIHALGAFAPSDLKQPISFASLQATVKEQQEKDRTEIEEESRSLGMRKAKGVRIVLQKPVKTSALSLLYPAAVYFFDDFDSVVYGVYEERVALPLDVFGWTIHQGLSPSQEVALSAETTVPRGWKEYQIRWNYRVLSQFLMCVISVVSDYRQSALVCAELLAWLWTRDDLNAFRYQIVKHICEQPAVAEELKRPGREALKRALDAVLVNRYYERLAEEDRRVVVATGGHSLLVCGRGVTKDEKARFFCLMHVNMLSILSKMLLLIQTSGVSRF